MTTSHVRAREWEILASSPVSGLHSKGGGRIMNCACAISLKGPHSAARRQAEAAAALSGPKAGEAVLHQVG